MLENYRDLIANQFMAALQTLENCVNQCPDTQWHALVAKFPFSQTVFHTLFFADLYLGLNTDVQPEQEFHKTHAQQFAGYDQLDDGTQPHPYDREFIRKYFQHCRDKVAFVLPSENEDSLATASGFPWLKTTRAEVHVYNIRHIQHHAAQLVLILRNRANQEMAWIKSGSE